MVVGTTEVTSVEAAAVVGLVASELPVGEGTNVKVAPSVVTVTGVVIPVGDVMVSVPMMITTTPDEVEVTGPELGDVVVCSGSNVKVAPSVVSVTGVVTGVGAVTMSVPMMTTTMPEVVDVSGSSSVVVVVGDVGSGWNVKVTPSVVSVTGVVRWLGDVTVSVPMITTTRPDEVDVTGSAGVVVGIGSNVRVTPLVVSTSCVVIVVGTVTVSVPMMTTGMPPEIVVVMPALVCCELAWDDGVPADEIAVVDVTGGDNVMV